jgi:aspartate aminotransferase
MEYLPIGGLRDFNIESVKLAYGDDADVLRHGQVAAVQSLSGTGSCRLFAEFQARFMPGSKVSDPLAITLLTPVLSYHLVSSCSPPVTSKVYIPVPTWSNHHNIWRDARVQESTYRYYHPATRGIDMDGLLEDIKAAPKGSVFLLHACAHNPTGVDPSPEQWKAISKLMLECGHFPFFDMAYQGFASGDTDRDAQAIRIFLADGHRMGVSQSYAKNMGLYGQRVGCLSIVCDSPKEASAIESQVKAVARPTYSNPPLHGALLVAKILHDKDLKGQWKTEVKGMADRIIHMRSLLRKNLEAEQYDARKTPGDEKAWTWGHITDQVGLMIRIPLTPSVSHILVSVFCRSVCLPTRACQGRWWTGLHQSTQYT